MSIWTPPKFGNAPFGPELTRGLVGYWPLDDQGGIAYDRSGHGNNGTLVGNTVTAISTRGRCLSFDGAGDYVNVGNNESLNFGTLTNFSISGWFKTESTNDYMWIVTKGQDFNTSMFGIRKFSDHKLHFRIYDNLDVGVDLVTNNVINDGVWHHVVAVANRNGNATMYIDANLQTDSQNISSVGNITHTLQSLRISRNPDLNVTTQDWNGLIDEVMIFNRALSAQEVQQLYLYGLHKHRDLIELWTAATSGTIIPLIQYYNQQARA